MEKNILRVKLIAKPDHSLNLINNKKLFSDKGISMEVETLNAAKKNSLLKKLVPKISTVNKDVKISYFLTFCAHINRFFLKHGFDTGRLFYSICDRYYMAKAKSVYDIVHSWPMFYYSHTEENCIHLSDCYELNPRYVEGIYKKEYQKYGFKYDSKVLYRNYHNYKTILDSKLVVTPSKLVVDSYRGEVSKDRFVINPYGALGLTYNPSPIDLNEKRVFAFVGRVCLEKGIGTLLDVSEMLKGHSVEFLVIGPVDRHVRELLKTRELDNCRFLGAIPKNEVLKKITQADFFIMPSLSDAYCMAVMEALSVGLPSIVSSRTGCSNEIVTHEMGMIYDVDDVDELCSKIISFSNMSLEQYEIYRDNIKKYFEREFVDNYVSRTADLYNSLR